ncbi:hypothetical protein FY145_21145 [Agrobacterium tumefaciens]|uniref:Uncharacterized protein n=1 Tax=Agrobacterium tumefaciens TaxID=358 RepID=A0AAP9LGU0_AGRTU|nr:hypothetical protein [Agrobacterium tumefaciens]NSZ61248.1 hypothetical protein [Agrobacterium tumefaciens]QHW12005.1 hypothetical protein CG010_28055 [Agrobacterium tumefaciens]UXS46942.1 hypothetical protein FY149_06850 [Agrobacterium tumefaciens]UXS72475.1 hypothetical protein FY146_18075 [Agrobacterium tumefaciens]UXS80689.1 hypothetical protein FY145_21145 [Agrobacterium tumefaciens]
MSLPAIAFFIHDCAVVFSLVLDRAENAVREFQKPDAKEKELSAMVEAYEARRAQPDL